MPTRSRISGWWIANHYIYHPSYYLSLCRILLPRPQVWKIPFLHCSLPLLCCSMSPQTSPLTLDLPFIRAAQLPTPHELHLEIPAWAQNPSRMQRLVVFNAMPQAISVSTVPSMNVLAVANELPVTLNTAASEIIAPTVNVSPTWPTIVPIVVAPSVMPPITFLSTVLLRRTQAWVSSLMRETQRGSDVVPVVQVFEGGIVTVRGCGLIFSVVHLPPLTTDSPFTFTVLIVFFADTFRYIVW